MINFLKFSFDVVYSLLFLVLRFFFERTISHREEVYQYPRITIRREDLLGETKTVFFHLDAVRRRFGKLRLIVSKRKVAKLLAKGMKMEFITIPAPSTPQDRVDLAKITLWGYQSTIIPTDNIHDISVDFLTSVHYYTVKGLPKSVYCAVVIAVAYMVFDVLQGFGVL